MLENEKLSEAEFFSRRAFGLRIGFGASPALIVIDMAKAFTDESAMLGSHLDAQIAATVPLLEVTHSRNVPVFFSTVRYDARDLQDAGIWASKQKGLVTLTAEGNGWEIEPRLDFRKTDTLLVKNTPPVFSAQISGSSW